MSYDKEKNREYQRKWYKNNKHKKIRIVDRNRKELREHINNIKRDGICYICGRSGKDFPEFMDFHHIDSVNKTDGIGNMISHGYSEKRILNEIEKCKIICKNCHAKIHRTINKYEWYVDFRKELICEKCGERDSDLLVLHHISTEEKEMEISTMLNCGYSIEKISEEISKCMCLCLECHTRIHLNI